MYVPLVELTLTKDNYSLTLIDGLTMETIVTCYGGLISRAGSMVHVGNYVKITMPSNVSKIFTVHTNSCILYILHFCALYLKWYFISVCAGLIVRRTTTLW